MIALEIGCGWVKNCFDNPLIGEGACAKQDIIGSGCRRIDKSLMIKV